METSQPLSLAKVIQILVIILLGVLLCGVLGFGIYWGYNKYHAYVIQTPQYALQVLWKGKLGNIKAQNEATVLFDDLEGSKIEDSVALGYWSYKKHILTEQDLRRELFGKEGLKEFLAVAKQVRDIKHHILSAIDVLIYMKAPSFAKIEKIEERIIRDNDGNPINIAYVTILIKNNFKFELIMEKGEKGWIFRYLVPDSEGEKFIYRWISLLENINNEVDRKVALTSIPSWLFNTGTTDMLETLEKKQKKQ